MCLLVLEPIRADWGQDRDYYPRSYECESFVDVACHKICHKITETIISLTVLISSRTVQISHNKGGTGRIRRVSVASGLIRLHAHADHPRSGSMWAYQGAGGI